MRHEIAQTAPNCAHTLKQQAEHEAVCGFINGIWTHLAIKNKVSIRDGVPVFAALTQSKEGDINEPTN